MNSEKIQTEMSIISSSIKYCGSRFNSVQRTVSVISVTFNMMADSSNIHSISKCFRIHNILYLVMVEMLQIPK